MSELIDYMLDRSSEEIQHAGVKGMKWGVRRYQKKLANRGVSGKRLERATSEFGNAHDNRRRVTGKAAKTGAALGGAIGGVRGAIGGAALGRVMGGGKSAALGALTGAASGALGGAVKGGALGALGGYTYGSFNSKGTRRVKKKYK